MTIPANLTPTEWSKVLSDGSEPERVAKKLLNGNYLSWNGVLIRFTEDSQKVLDLGSGRGENSAMLALQGRHTTLLDWSQDNLDFSRRLFESLGKEAQFYRSDMTQELPFKDQSFDTVFSCGVFEYFTDQEIKSILREALRVSRKRVIILVPNALSVFYRVGKCYMEKNNQWPWGGERPFATLKPYFSEGKHLRVSEFTVGAKHSLDFLTMPGGKRIKKIVETVFNLKDHPEPSLFKQGYLLVTIGEKI